MTLAEPQLVKSLALALNPVGWMQLEQALAAEPEPPSEEEEAAGKKPQASACAQLRLLQQALDRRSEYEVHDAGHGHATVGVTERKSRLSKVHLSRTSLAKSSTRGTPLARSSPGKNSLAKSSLAGLCMGADDVADQGEHGLRSQRVQQVQILRVDGPAKHSNPGEPGCQCCVM